MPGYSISQVDTMKLCVVMVGLPARGKSLIARKIVRYLSWLSITAKSFNVGEYRRGYQSHPTAEFFDDENLESLKIRKQALKLALDDLIDWFNNSNGMVGVLDGTSMTREKRESIYNILKTNQIQPLFLESFCNDQETIMHNILDVKMTSPDYINDESKSDDNKIDSEMKINIKDPEFIINDFLKRISYFEKSYEPLDQQKDSDKSFIKLINVAQQIIINRIETYLQSRIVYFVMNLHIKPRTIWLSRHGESMYNLEGKIGGDAGLSPRGLKYAEKLPELVRQSAGYRDLTVWISTLKRTAETSQHLPYKKLQWKALDELDAGVCDGMTYEEIENKFPEDFKARDDNKYEYRYRGGESYRDVVIRLEPIIMELERQENILIVTHQAVLRCIYAYFMNVPQEESPWMSIPLHTLIKLEPKAYGTTVTRIKANIPAVSTYKEKGTSQLGEDLTDTSNKSKNIIISAKEELFNGTR
ncbi:fructose-2,6-bisphosphatase [Ascoidea rubescens DSM 1968]|uniref:fructose-2,6-bisphosphate 2-phosphatase n=1 Tax=Ascoidea rubescens DSM 1968 TaxID=1344418 RepID=A0A1D2VBQ2_9ASCO|nr:bifunctional 6-phosphofructo-2-kinase/fructose-2,6-bisphosphate 2-phosphatase [Ascoidea rubescens DSM 1968]ODV59108.1 bifunctional 6-phosphofructo-2-kinase/fructose-2,6-bisphosphate 2-phosphatase [Ascoidea rubescens DSM 1968]